MPNFAYTGRTRAGQTVSGERAADTMDAASAALRREQIQVTKITPAKGKEAAAKKEKEKGVGKLGKKASAKNLAVFTRQFSVMIDAGLPLVQCLDILGTQEEDKNFAAVILDTRTSVESGASLAEAMKKHPKTFDPLFTNMIAAGEAGGILDTILKRLATYIEKAVKLNGQVKSAMIYPVAIVVIAGVVVGVILWKVIPTFASLFSGLGADLPLPTRVVIGLSNNLVKFFPVIFIGGGAAAWGFKTYYGTANGRRMIDMITLKMPILGNIMRKIAVARFCRTLSTLISSGVPILDGLEITAKTAGNADRRRRHHGDAQEHRARRNDLGAAEGDEGLPADGDADDRRRRGDRRARHDAREDCRLLRRRGRRRGGRPADAARADHDRRARRRRRRHRHRDVHADLRFDFQADVSNESPPRTQTNLLGVLCVLCLLCVLCAWRAKRAK